MKPKDMQASEDLETTDTKQYRENVQKSTNQCARNSQMPSVITEEPNAADPDSSSDSNSE